MRSTPRWRSNASSSGTLSYARSSMRRSWACSRNLARPAIGAVQCLEQREKKVGVLPRMEGPHNFARRSMQGVGDIVFAIDPGRGRGKLFALWRPSVANARIEVDIGFVDVQHLKIGVAVVQGCIDSSHPGSFMRIPPMQGRISPTPASAQPIEQAAWSRCTHFQPVQALHRHRHLLRTPSAAQIMTQNLRRFFQQLQQFVD